MNTGKREKLLAETFLQTATSMRKISRLLADLTDSKKAPLLTPTEINKVKAYINENGYDDVTDLYAKLPNHNHEIIDDVVSKLKERENVPGMKTKKGTKRKRSSTAGEKSKAKKTKTTPKKKGTEHSESEKESSGEEEEEGS
eukprot:TRINITY_DN11242_c0_g1_i1.p1 TRINITY_DN11242_c0_g1~~TRINITY_DN11242_c0_g1_i1.p1  ORF type:complete len:142 (-),score=39.02 TRINITY_DN11242_c0_g1_i1:29-454(-)